MPLDKLVVKQFQFQNGTIRRGGGGDDRTARRDFNSKMVRLEVHQRKQQPPHKVHFNSKMVRLEAFA